MYSSTPEGDAPPPGPTKGRGTVWAIEHRFAERSRGAFDDGWGEGGAPDDAPPPVTQVTEERVRSILAGNDSPDIGFDLSINPYRGCEHVMRRDKVLPDPYLSPLPDFF